MKRRRPEEDRGHGQDRDGSGPCSTSSSAGRFWENHRKKTTSMLSKVVGKGILRKLAHRECQRSPPSSAIGVIRRMCTDIYPSNSTLVVKMPDFHIRAFTSDGKFLVCFSMNLRRVLLYRYFREDQENQKQQGPACFETFFKKVFELEVVQEGESLCKTFSITAKQGKFLILGSSTKCIQQQSNLETTPTFEKVSLHVIDLERGIQSDQVSFEKDFICLRQNNGISMFNDTLAALSVKTQTIHFFHLNSIGKLVKMRSIGEYIFEDDERLLSMHNIEGGALGIHGGKSSGGIGGIGGISGEAASSGAREEARGGEERGATPSESDVGPYTGIKQRLLGHLVKNALKDGEKPGENKSLKDFFFHFKDYQNLIMWKMQMLDSVHLLIKFDKSPLFGSDSQSLHARYSGVFNIQSGLFVCFLLDKNEELAYLYQNFSDFFIDSDHLWSRFVSSYSNDQYLRAQLDRQRDRYNKIYGSEAEPFLVKQISSLLPLSPQMTNSSPYLDARLFQFDDRFISAYSGPRPIAEHAIKFLTRGAQSCTRFKIDPVPDSDEEEESLSDSYVTYVFHPVFPFAISCICNHMSQTPKVMKFYFR